jgi:hypothetical protein
VSVASNFEPFDRENVFYDLETWQALFEGVAEGNPAVADSLAMVLFRVIRELSTRPEGVERTINTLKLGVEWLFQYTSAHEVSFKLFLYDLECVLVPSDSPKTLIGAAIERAEAAATRIYSEPPSAERG